MIDEVIAVCVPLAVILLGWYLKRIDTRNTEQHASAAEKRLETAAVVKTTLEDQQQHLVEHLVRIEEKVDIQGQLVATHLAYHAHSPNPAKVEF